MTFALRAYLDRIGLDAVPPGEAGLAALQSAQMRAIPFEAIDPLLGIVPDLAPDALWRKLVVEGRGGYCYEQNLLLGSALKALGYRARPVLARVRMRLPQGGARSHLAWIVGSAEGDFLVDAGFGGPGPATPLRLAPGAEQVAGGVRFRLVADAATGETVLETGGDAGWAPLYAFDEARVTPADVEAANFVSARGPDSPFPVNLMLSRLTAEGRVTLFNRAGSTGAGGPVRRWTVGSAAELADRLAGDFRLAAAAPLAGRIWARLPADTTPG